MEAIEGRAMTTSGTVYEANGDLPQVVLVSPDDAQEILNTCDFQRQRHIRKWWPVKLAGFIHKGQWKITMINLVKCQEDAKTYLLDGYHRLSAIVQAKQAAPLVVFRETCDTLHEVGILYSRMDAGLSRSISDGLRARDAGTEMELPLPFLKAGVGAIGVINAGFAKDRSTHARRSIDDAVEQLTQWQTELHAYWNAISGAPSTVGRKLKSAPVMAVALALFRDQPEKAGEFFSAVAGSESLEPETGQHVLVYNVLMEGDDAKHGSHRYRSWTALTCRQVAMCWNAFMEGRPILVVRVRNPESPLLLAGTRYTRWGRRKNGNDPTA